MTFEAHLRTRLLSTAPAVALGLLAVADLQLGRGNTVIGVLAVVPLLAALVHGPLVTAVYGAVALASGAGLGAWDDVYTPGSERNAQVVRLLTITVCAAVAVVASRDRISREGRLLRMTTVADAAQRAILLPVPDRVGPVLLAVHYESAATDALIGGDLYSVIDTPAGPTVLVGDVRGKGLDAVRMSAQVLAAFRERATDAPDLATLMGRLDGTVTRAASSEEEFVTALLLRIGPDGVVQIASAGHPGPFVLTGGRTRLLDLPGARPPLGIGGATVTTELRLEPGDRLLLYTDGLTEARDPRTRAFFSARTIAGTLSTDAPARDVLDALRSEVLAWSGGSLADDIALVIVEYAPVRTPARRATDVPAGRSARESASADRATGP